MFIVRLRLIKLKAVASEVETVRGESNKNKYRESGGQEEGLHVPAEELRQLRNGKHVKDMSGHFVFKKAYYFTTEY